MAAKAEVALVNAEAKVLKKVGASKTVKIKVLNFANEAGADFEKFLVEKLGGKGSFIIKSTKYGTREFDGAIGNIWYEAKSGEALNRLLLSPKELNDFKKSMGKGLKIASENNMKYELHAQRPSNFIRSEWS